MDKTRLIEQLLDRWGKVNFFIRPRRFGKTVLSFTFEKR
ncbi:MAG: AAA family ATPase [Streptococcus sp.]